MFSLVTILISMVNYIAQLDKRGTGIPIFFICHGNICCGYTFEASHESLQMSSHNKCLCRQIRIRWTKCHVSSEDWFYVAFYAAATDQKFAIQIETLKH